MMPVDAILKWLEATALAGKLRDSVLLFPLTESIHVIALALVFGTIMVIDLRLLGIASAERPFSRMAPEILKWTWAAFALSVLTGALMFMTNAGVYYHNFYFRTKMLLLALSGLNMAVFELTAGREAHSWGQSRTTPRAGKIAATLSLALWIGVIFMGRLTGFTTTRATEVAPPPASVNFDDFLQAAPPASSGAPTPPAR
jgi:hypothetical protein